jgi:hypothetical protein
MLSVNRTTAHLPVVVVPVVRVGYSDVTHPFFGSFMEGHTGMSSTYGTGIKREKHENVL